LKKIVVWISLSHLLLHLIVIHPFYHTSKRFAEKGQNILGVSLNQNNHSEAQFNPFVSHSHSSHIDHDINFDDCEEQSAIQIFSNFKLYTCFNFEYIDIEQFYRITNFSVKTTLKNLTPPLDAYQTISLLI